MFNNVVNAWWPLLFYSASDAPRFKKGMITLICVSVATLGITAVVWYLERREKRSRALGVGNVENDVVREKSTPQDHNADDDNQKTSSKWEEVAKEKGNQEHEKAA
jgi:MFS transporter, ACS family, pantothenate transporter